MLTLRALAASPVFRMLPTHYLGVQLESPSRTWSERSLKALSEVAGIAFCLDTSRQRLAVCHQQRLDEFSLCARTLVHTRRKNGTQVGETTV